MSTNVIHAPIIEEDLDLFPYEETEDPDKRAHIVNPPNNLHIYVPGMKSQEIVDIARMTGQYVTALCQYRFIPKHNPDKLDACDACMKIAGDMMREAGE